MKNNQTTNEVVAEVKAPAVVENTVEIIFVIDIGNRGDIYK